MYETYFQQNWLPRWNQILTQLRFIHNWVIMGIQWMVRWWVLVQGGVFVLDVSSFFPWQDLDERITRIQSARWLSPLLGAVVSVMPLSWGITLHIIERLWWDFDSFVHFFGPFELQRTANKQIQPSQNHYIPIFTNLPQVGIWDN
jgi:hypothetical protein